MPNVAQFDRPENPDPFDRGEVKYNQSPAMPLPPSTPGEARTVSTFSDIKHILQVTAASALHFEITDALDMEDEVDTDKIKAMDDFKFVQAKLPTTQDVVDALERLCTEFIEAFSNGVVTELTFTAEELENIKTHTNQLLMNVGKTPIY